VVRSITLGPTPSTHSILKADLAKHVQVLLGQQDLHAPYMTVFIPREPVEVLGQVMGSLVACLDEIPREPVEVLGHVMGSLVACLDEKVTELERGSGMVQRKRLGAPAICPSVHPM